MTAEQKELRERLAQIKARAEAASPGPWEIWSGCSWRRIGRVGHQGERPVIEPIVSRSDGHPDLTGPNREYDLDFIAHARADIPWLIEQLEAAGWTLPAPSPVEECAPTQHAYEWKYLKPDDGVRTAIFVCVKCWRECGAGAQFKPEDFGLPPSSPPSPASDARVRELEQDQRTLDAVLDVLGIADTDRNPADYCKELFVRLEAAEARVTALTEALTPPHKCEPVARAFMGKNRDWWIGKLIEPVAEWPRETHCLHMLTPLKDVAFLCNRGDFENLMLLANAVVGLDSLDWLKRVTEAVRRRAALPEEPRNG